MAAHELHELLDNAIAEGVTRLVFDFSVLSHISSDGLRVILKAIEEEMVKVVVSPTKKDPGATVHYTVTPNSGEVEHYCSVHLVI